MEECPHAARELLNNILLRHLIDREPLPVPSSRRTAEENTLDYKVGTMVVYPTEALFAWMARKYGISLLQRMTVHHPMRD